MIRYLQLALLTVVACVTATTEGWPYWGGDLNNTRSTTQSLIHPANIGAGLETVWQETLNGAVSASPLIYDGLVVIPTWAGYLYALDATAGSVRWQTNISDYTLDTRCRRPDGSAVAGVPSLVRATPALAETDLIVVGTRAEDDVWETGLVFTLGIQLSTGELQWCTLVDEQPIASITQSGTAFEGSFYVGTASQQNSASPSNETTFRSSFFRINATTGELVWRTFIVPDEGFAGSSVWGSMPPINPDTRQIYIGTGQNYKTPSDYLACRLSGALDTEECGLPPNYANSLLALSLDTGEIEWHNQLGPLEAWVAACIDFSGDSTRLNLTDIDLFLPKQGLDTSDASTLAYTRTGFPPDLLPAGCPAYPGTDSDFSAAPILSYCEPLGKTILMAANKGGYAFAVEPHTGDKIWASPVGPGGILGGSMFGPAADTRQLYLGINTRYILLPVPGAQAANSTTDLQKASANSPNVTSHGFWTALDCATGEPVWQTASPLPGNMAGQLTVANGVLFGASGALNNDTESTLFALDTKDGTILTAANLGTRTVQNGPSIAKNVLYQGTGYALSSTKDNKLPGPFWAFTVKGNPDFPDAAPAAQGQLAYVNA